MALPTLGQVLTGAFNRFDKFSDAKKCKRKKKMSSSDAQHGDGKKKKTKKVKGDESKGY